MSRRHDAALAIFIGACAILGAGVGFGIKDSMAQSAPRPTRSTTPSGTMWSRGFATDGGVTSASMQTETATVGELDAGTAWVGDLNVSGRTTLKNLDVMGPAAFNPRPSGIVLSGSLVKASPQVIPLTSLNAWVSIGTVAVPGALANDFCAITGGSTGFAILQAHYRCVMGPGGVADLQYMALVGLTIPAGTYQVRVIGP